MHTQTVTTSVNTAWGPNAIRVDHMGHKCVHMQFTNAGTGYSTHGYSAHLIACCRSHYPQITYNNTQPCHTANYTALLHHSASAVVLHEDVFTQVLWLLAVLNS